MRLKQNMEREQQMRSIINPDDMSTNVNGWSMNMSSRVLIRMMKTMILINLYFVSLKLVPILHFIITMIRTQLSSLPAHTNNQYISLYIVTYIAMHAIIYFNQIVPVSSYSQNITFPLSVDTHPTPTHTPPAPTSLSSTTTTLLQHLHYQQSSFQTHRNTKMINHILLLFLLTLTSSIQSCSSTQSDTLTIGNTAILCLEYQGNETIENGTYQFKITVDDFAAVKVSGIKNILSTHPKVSAEVLFQNSDASKKKTMKIADNSIEGGIYRDILSLVINIENGTFTKITLDNEDCTVCLHGDGTQACSADTSQECYSKANKFNGDDPKIFVSWIGTDSNGDHLLSHTKRLSRFSQYSVGSIYQSAKNLVVS